jgi:hypothetical protein
MDSTSESLETQRWWCRSVEVCFFWSFNIVLRSKVTKLPHLLTCLQKDEEVRMCWVWSKRLVLVGWFWRRVYKLLIQDYINENLHSIRNQDRAQEQEHEDSNMLQEVDAVKLRLVWIIHKQTEWIIQPRRWGRSHRGAIKRDSLLKLSIRVNFDRGIFAGAF